MPSVAGMAGLITGVESPYITVHQERCCLVRNRNADCLRCAQACTSGCITFADGVLSVEPGRCIGCGTCATVCPTCCLEAHHPNDAELVGECRAQMARAQGAVTIACAAVIGKARELTPGAVRVECLGRVEEALLTTLVAEGARSIELLCGPCASCPHASGRAAADLVLQTEGALLEAWGVPSVVRVAQIDVDDVATPFFDTADEQTMRGSGTIAITAGEPDIDTTSDRASTGGGASCDGVEAAPEADGMTHGTDSVALAAGDTGQGPWQTLRVDVHGTQPSKPHYTKVMADGTLPHFVPDRRERLLDALAMLGEPADVPLQTRLWGHVQIDTDVCTSCRMCAVFCPTGAIFKYDGEDGMGVTHTPGDCVRCGTCQSICRAHALRLVGEVRACDLMGAEPQRIAMKGPRVEKGKAHTIWQMAQTFTNTTVYER